MIPLTRTQNRRNQVVLTLAIIRKNRASFIIPGDKYPAASAVSPLGRRDNVIAATAAILFLLFYIFFNRGLRKRLDSSAAASVVFLF